MSEYTGLVLPSIGYRPIPSDALINRWERRRSGIIVPRHDIIVPVRRAAAAILFTDVTNARTDLSDATSFGGNSIPVGATLIIGLVATSGIGTFAASDTLNGAWAHVRAYVQAGGEAIDVFAFRGSAAGTLTANLTLTGSASYYATWLVVTGLDISASVLADSIDEATNTTHVCATTGLTGTGLYLGLASLGTNTDVTVGGGWATDNNTTGVGVCIERKIETGTLEKGPYTTSASVVAESNLVFFPETAVDPRTDGKIIIRGA